jgi:multimeric flavodoxin WrbA
VKIALINGSPKPSQSASGRILQFLQPLLESERHENTLHAWRRPDLDSQDALDLCECDALIFAFPLYVDGIPSHLLNCLMQLEERLAHIEKDIKVYAIVNCGFYEGHQARWALAMMENWCHRAQVQWGYGIGLGAGGILAGDNAIPLDVGPNRNLGQALRKLAHSVTNRVSDQNLFITANFPKLLYKLGGEMGWRKNARANGLRARDLSMKR